MQRFYEYFSNFINNEDLALINNSEVLHCNINKKSRRIDLGLYLDKLIDYSIFSKLQNELKNTFELNVSNVEIKYHKSLFNLDDIEKILSFVVAQNPIVNGFFDGVEAEEDDGVITLCLKHGGRELLESQNMDKIISKFLYEKFDVDYDVSFLEVKAFDMEAAVRQAVQEKEAQKAKQEEERKAAEAKQKAEEPKRKEQERKEAEEREKFRKEVVLPAIATIVKFRQEKNNENGIVLANSHGSMVAIGLDAEKLSESLNLPINEFEIEDAGSMKVVTFSDTELEAKTELLDALNVDYTVSDENGEVILSSVEDSKDENVNESASNDVSASETEDEDETIEEEEEENVSRGRSR